MTETTGLPGTDRSGHPALSRLITAGVDEFAADHWGRRPLLCAADDLGGDFRDLLSGAAVDELVSERGLRSPFLRVAKDGSTMPAGAFTAGGGIGAGIADQVSDDRLVELFADGATMVLQGLHRSWPPILTFCQQLAAELGHPVQANAYVTPPQNQGFDDHYDVHDVFVLQIEGEKEWTIHSPVLPSPLRSQPWTDRRAAVEHEAAEAPLIKTVLRPGDCLYLPRGYLHSAKALGGISIHLTIGVHSWTRYHLAEQLSSAALRSLTEDEAARLSLPFAVDVADGAELHQQAELVRERLVEAIRAVPDHVVAAAMAVAVRDTQRAAPVGPLAQLAARSGLDADTPVRLRDHVRPSVQPDPQTPVDGSAVLVSRAGRVPLTDTEAAAVAPLLQGHTLRAGELGLELARRLLRAAVLVPG